MRMSLRPPVEDGRGPSGALDHPLEAAAFEHPLQLGGEEEHGGDRGRVVRLVLHRILERDPQRQERRDPPRSGDGGTLRLDLTDSLERGWAQHRKPQPTVRREPLLRREVVGVGFAHVHGKSAGGRGRIDQYQRVTGVARAMDGHHHAGGGLVVRPRDHVRAWVRRGLGRVARLGLEHDRLGEEWRCPRRGGELGGELPVSEMERPLAHQAAGGGVPERSGASVAEGDLVLIGQREQLPQARADSAHHLLDRLLAVRGAHQTRAGLRQTL